MQVMLQRETAKLQSDFKHQMLALEAQLRLLNVENAQRTEAQQVSRRLDSPYLAPLGRQTSSFGIERIDIGDSRGNGSSVEQAARRLHASSTAVSDFERPSTSNQQHRAPGGGIDSRKVLPPARAIVDPSASPPMPPAIELMEAGAAISHQVAEPDPSSC